MNYVSLCDDVLYSLLIGTPKPLMRRVFRLTRESPKSQLVLVFLTQRIYAFCMRKYLDIPLTLIVTTVLTVAMLWPIHQPPPAPDGTDKIVHLIAFAALAFPLARTGRIGLIPVFVGASAFGGLIELIQPSFGRSADMQDWIADIAGVGLGIVLALLYRRLRKHRA